MPSIFQHSDFTQYHLHRTEVLSNGSCYRREIIHIYLFLLAPFNLNDDPFHELPPIRLLLAARERCPNFLFKIKRPYDAWSKLVTYNSGSYSNF